jgi:hypothetical protein
MFKAVVEGLGSGVSTVNLVLDGKPEGPMAILSVHGGGHFYTKNLNISPGSRVWLVAATDNLGNTALSGLIEFTLIIDDQPPSISTVIISPSAPVWREAVEVSADISDSFGR